MSIPLYVYQPSQVLGGVDDGLDLDRFDFRLLAEGDSWFSLGTFNPVKISNLLCQMEFDRWYCAINCATPGENLSLMVDRHHDPSFNNLLAGRQASKWDALVVSGGGNDLIYAIRCGWRGDVTDPTQRLILCPPEWGPAADGVSRYISEAGWQRFATYIQSNLDALIALRDGSLSAGCPVFMHTYAFMTPRFAPALPGTEAFIAPALQAFGIPRADWTALTRELLTRFAQLLLDAAANQARYPGLHVYDTTAVPILPANPESTGSSGDWANETHLARSGYEKLGLAWSRAIRQVMAATRP